MYSKMPELINIFKQFAGGGKGAKRGRSGVRPVNDLKTQQFLGRVREVVTVGNRCGLYTL